MNQPNTGNSPAIIYNVTSTMGAAIAENWLQWIRNKHIPEMIATGCFQQALILQLTDVDESDGPTFAVQYQADSRAHFNRYLELHADDLRKRAVDRWGDRVLSFRTVLRVVN